MNDVKLQIDKIEKIVNQTTNENQVKTLIKDIRNLNETMVNQIQNFIQRMKHFTIMFLKVTSVVKTKNAIHGQVFLGLLKEDIILTLEPSEDKQQVSMKIVQQDDSLKLQVTAELDMSDKDDHKLKVKAKYPACVLLMQDDQHILVKPITIEEKVDNNKLES